MYRVKIKERQVHVMLFWFIVFIMLLINIAHMPYNDGEIKRKKKVLIDDMYKKHHER